MTIDGKALRWGKPPLPLVPAALSGRLAGVPLPPLVGSLLDEPGKSLGSLTVDAWPRLPREKPARRHIHRAVASQIHAFSFELREVPVGVPQDPGAHWTPRATIAWEGALLRSGKGESPLTFGALLDVPGTGVVAALEVAALLEHDGAAVVDSSPEATLPIMRWGYPGCALLPRSLRRTLESQALPKAVAEDLGLAPGATAGTLDETVWLHAHAISRRVEEHLLGLVDARPVRRLRVMDGRWPPTCRPEKVPWPKRLRGGLERAGLLDPARLHLLTYGDLLDLPSVGKKSAIEFGVIADALCAEKEEGPPADGGALLAAADEAWTGRIVGDDQRFADVLPSCGTTLRAMLREAADRPGSRQARVVARALEAARARAAEVGDEPIERAVPRLAAALGIPRRDLDVTADRLGWRQPHRLTLREVGARHGITRERVRQLVDRTTDLMDGAFLPQVERAASLLAAHAPMTGTDASALLAAEGLSGEPLDPWSVLSLAEATGYGAGFRIDDTCGVRLVLPSGPVDAAAVLQAARRATARTGVARLCRVPTAVTGRNPANLPLPVVTLVLRHAPGVAFLDDDWFWLPSTPPARNSLQVATRRMLAVAGQLDLATVREGLVRCQRAPRHQVAPPSVLAAFYRDHPDFTIQGDVVGSAEPLDLAGSLTSGEQALVLALRRAPGGQLSRSALQQAVAAYGVNPDAFASLVATTPILGHRGHDAWCLRGG
jgi:hypothetical protein